MLMHCNVCDKNLSKSLVSWCIVQITCYELTAMSTKFCWKDRKEVFDKNVVKISQIVFS